MSNLKTKIEWTDATWSPVTGCTKVSPGCAHCYAETVALRFWPTQYDEVTAKLEDLDDPGDLGIITRPRLFTDVQCHEDRLDQPLHWKRPRKVFVNSMSDLFHESVPDAFIDRVFAVMALAPQHTFQILTKRAERTRDYLTSWPDGAGRAHHVRSAAHRLINAGSGRSSWFATDPAFQKALDSGETWPLPNVWLGVSVENDRWRTRIDELLITPAAVRFVSAEPLLDELDLTAYLEGDALAAPGPGGFRKGPRLDWVITGAESGRGARVMDEDWVRSLRDQCEAAGVPFFYKQRAVNGRKIGLPPLDGVVWNQFPEARQ